MFLIKAVLMLVILAFAIAAFLPLAYARQRMLYDLAHPASSPPWLRWITPYIRFNPPEGTPPWMRWLYPVRPPLRLDLIYQHPRALRWFWMPRLPSAGFVIVVFAFVFPVVSLVYVLIASRIPEWSHPERLQAISLAVAQVRRDLHQEYTAELATLTRDYAAELKRFQDIRGGTPLAQVSPDAAKARLSAAEAALAKAETERQHTLADPSLSPADRRDIEELSRAELRDKQAALNVARQDIEVAQRLSTMAEDHKAAIRMAIDKRDDAITKKTAEVREKEHAKAYPP